MLIPNCQSIHPPTVIKILEDKAAKTPWSSVSVRDSEMFISMTMMAMP